MRKALVSVVAAAVGVAWTSNDARALGPVNVEVGLEGGFGSTPAPYPPNSLGLGLGGRAGVSMFNIYGGVRAMYYLGSSEVFSVREEGANTCGIESTAAHSRLYGIEGGYDFKLGELTIRPQVGVGDFTGTASQDCSTSTSQTNFYVEPGVTGLMSFGHVYVGADMNYLVVLGVKQGDGTSVIESALTVHAQFGVTF